MDFVTLRWLLAPADDVTLSWPGLTVSGILGVLGLTAALLALRGKLISNAVMKVMLADKDKQIEHLQAALASKDRTMELQAQLLVNNQEMQRTTAHVLTALPKAVEAVEAIHDH